MSLFTKLFGLGESDHYNKGIEYYNSGEYDKAVVEFEEVIRTIDELDTPRKHYRLVEQLEAAATSVSMNIAEGKGRQ